MKLIEEMLKAVQNAADTIQKQMTDMRGGMGLPPGFKLPRGM